jgi:hypothetical protein
MLKIQFFSIHLSAPPFLMCLILICFIVGCNMLPTPEPLVELFEAHVYQPGPMDLSELSAVEGNAAIKFPPSAHEIHAYMTGIRDIFALVRFSMQATDLPVFLASTLCHESPEPVIPTTRTNSEFDWWIPDQAQYAEGCTGSNGPTRQEVIFDMTEEEIFIVFVSTSTY